MTVDVARLLLACEEGAAQPPLDRALLLLTTACPERSGDDWAEATIGERDARLLRLREELFGSRIEVTTRCPKCGELLELGFSTHAIEMLPCAAPAGRRVSESGYEVEFRLPTTVDLREASREGPADPRRQLLLRCVRSAHRRGVSVDPTRVPERIMKTVIQEMAKADPMADVQVGLSCPECGHGWSSPFDIPGYLWSEIDEWAARTLRDVHTLATAYGWVEADILALNPRRRQSYLDLVAG